MKVRIDWNASSDVKELMDKAPELEIEGDKANCRTKLFAVLKFLEA